MSSRLRHGATRQEGAGEPEAEGKVWPADSPSRGAGKADRVRRAQRKAKDSAGAYSLMAVSRAAPSSESLFWRARMAAACGQPQKTSSGRR